MILLPLLSVMQHSVNWSWETISDVRTAGLFYDIDEAFATSHPAVVAAVRLFVASQYPANGAEIAVTCVHRCMLKDGTVLRGAQYRTGKGMRKDCYVEVAPNEDAPVLWHGKVETFVAVRPTSTSQQELYAVIQPLAPTANWIQQMVCPSDAAWQDMAAWLAAGQLLSFASSFSQALTEDMPLKICPIAAIVGKVCLLSTPGRDDMMVVRPQNTVDEL